MYGVWFEAVLVLFGTVSTWKLLGHSNLICWFTSKDDHDDYGPGSYIKGAVTNCIVDLADIDLWFA